MDFSEGFLKSWGMILVSEIGDKTFFIAAILAMKNSRTAVFTGAFAALVAMTILSALLGWAAPNLISKVYTHWAAVALFVAFGLRSLYDAFMYEESEESEWDEVEREIGTSPKIAESQNSPSGRNVSQWIRQRFHPVMAEAFILTFLAEWGDRSQIATIGLAASSGVVGVTLGGILGHGICTGAAVLGGRHLASFVSERLIGFIGGLLFLAFAAHAIWVGVE